MTAVEIMVNEHNNIRRLIKVIRKKCFNLIKTNEINYDEFFQIVEFIKNYADKHHHGKEEIFLFNRMVENLGPRAEKVVKQGMLVEHDLGRLYVSELESALNRCKAGEEEAMVDIIGNAIGYANLLARHADKEDKVIYTYAERELSSEIIDEINNQCIEYEKEHQNIADKYLKILNKLEETI